MVAKGMAPVTSREFVVWATHGEGPLTIKRAAAVMAKALPPFVSAYRLVGAVKAVARVRTPRLINRMEAACQARPSSVLLKTPPYVPAYKVVGAARSIAEAEIDPPSGPMGVQTLSSLQATLAPHAHSTADTITS
jgi:hypothetical protein